MADSKNAFAFSAPGTIMVTGEHAVVYGHSAMVCAIEQCITIRIQPRTDRIVEIDSEIAPFTHFSLDNIEENHALRFVIACICLYKDKLTHGFTAKIESEINPTLGLGSSAAVTVAMLGCVRHLAGESTDKSACIDMHAEALSIVQGIQGRGSGADLAACIHGGLIAYQPQTNSSATIISALPTPPQFHLAYCGYKTPTADVLATIAKRMEGNEAQFETLYQTMGDSAKSAIKAAEASDWASLAEQLNHYQTLMKELGVSDDTLDKLIAEGNSLGALASKISGSGLGDCVLTMGDLHSNNTTFTPAVISENGLQYLSA